MGRVCRDNMSAGRAFVATCRNRRVARSSGPGLDCRGQSNPTTPRTGNGESFGLSDGGGRAAAGSWARRAPAQKQNGSRCCHRPPLVPGPNCRAGEGLASFLGGSNAFGASSSGVRGSGRGLATSVGSLRIPVRRTCRLSVCGSFGRSLRSRRAFEESGIGLRLTLLPRWSFHRAGCLRSEDRRPRPRWSRFRTFFPCGRSVPHRERPY